MLDIRINGQSADLTPGSSLAIEINNSIFDFEQVQGLIALPYVFPFTPLNHRLFRNQYLREISQVPVTEPVEVYDDDLIFSGTFKLTSIDGGYSGTFYFETGTFSQEIQNKKIRNLDLGTVNLTTETATSQSVYIAVPEPALNFIDDPYKYYLTFSTSSGGGFVAVNETRTYLQSSVADAMTEFEGKINLWLIENNLNVRALAEGNFIIFVWNTSPTFQVRVAIRENVLSGGFIQLYEQQNISYQVPVLDGIENNTFANGFAMPTHENPELYAEKNSGFLGTVNFYDSTGYHINTPDNPKRFSNVPMVFLRTVLNKIFENYEVSGSFWTDETLKNLLLYSLYTLDKSDPNLKVLNAMKSNFTIAGQLPDMGVGELLNNLRTMFCLGYFFDFRNKKLKIRFLKDVLSAPTLIDWTDKVVPDYNQDLPENVKYNFAFGLDADDATTKADESGNLPAELASYSEGTADAEVNFQPVFGSFSTETAAGRTGIKTSQNGISVFFEQITKTFQPRLLFWNGLQPNSLAPNFSYPEGKNTDRTGQYSLTWSGVTGLFEKYWKTWVAFLMKSRTLELSVRLTKADLITLDTSEKVHIAGQDYLIEQIKLTLPVKKPATVRLRQV